MPTFRYVVKNPQGRMYRGSIEIDSKRTAHITYTNNDIRKLAR